MTPLIHLKRATSLLSLVAIVLVCFVFAPHMQAVLPPPEPDGDYPGGNTAEGHSALFSITTGKFNTAIGFFSLDNNRTDSFNTAVGAGALFANHGDQNTATGAGALLSNTTGSFNTANGEAALFFNTIGSNNTAVGSSALIHNTTADNNTAIGVNAVQDNTSGGRNTAIGVGALLHSIGSDNIAVGVGAGTFLTAGGNNIYVGNRGAATENNTIRLGTPFDPDDDSGQNRAFIAGISGQNATGGDPVFITSDGKLGTVNSPSSARFKEEIQPMNQASEVILALKPVTFRYKKEFDPKRMPQFGLVAEEVEKVNPDLVKRDREGKVQTVRYEAVNAMLLNEFLKEHRKNEKQQATIAHLQKQIEALTATVQKVSAQLELSGHTPRTVLNNQ